MKSSVILIIYYAENPLLFFESVQSSLALE